MARRRAMVAAVLLGVACGAALAAGPAKGPGQDGMFENRAGDPDMERAYARSRADLPAFLALAAAPPPGTRGFAVKVGFPEPGGRRTEFFWITPFEQGSERFSGRLSNVPVHARQLRQGQIVTFARGEIVDWMYFDAEGRMHGNRTACVEVARQGPVAGAELARRYGLNCAGT